MLKNRDKQGQSLVEFLLILPLMFLLIINVVNFGTYLYAAVTLANAARTGAEYAIMGGAMASAPGTPANAAVATLVTNDIASLPNRSSLEMRICRNNNGTDTCTCMVGACTGMTATPTDPENTGGVAALYVLAAVDVKYTYQPLIPLWSFPGLGIQATLPTSTIRRKAVMRMMQ
jgi:Flp pilus assembly protein TadG